MNDLQLFQKGQVVNSIGHLSIGPFNWHLDNDYEYVIYAVGTYAETKAVGTYAETEIKSLKGTIWYKVCCLQTEKPVYDKFPQGLFTLNTSKQVSPQALSQVLGRVDKLEDLLDKHIGRVLNYIEIVEKRVNVLDHTTQLIKRNEQSDTLAFATLSTKIVELTKKQEAFATTKNIEERLTRRMDDLHNMTMRRFFDLSEQKNANRP